MFKITFFLNKAVNNLILKHHNKGVNIGKEIKRSKDKKQIILLLLYLKERQ